MPPLELRVEGVGYNDVLVPNIPAGKILKVQFIPGQQDQVVANSNFSPIYSQLGVYISVGAQSVATPLLNNGLQTGGVASKSPIVSFATAIQGNCAAGDLDCRVPVTIRISKPNYDYWCLNYLMYCPNTQMHGTHPWNGTLVIQTDDTDPIPAT